MKEIKTPRFWCPVGACGRGFVTLSPLTKHVRTYHADDEEAEYRRTPLEKIKKPLRKSGLFVTRSTRAAHHPFLHAPSSISRR